MNENVKKNKEMKNIFSLSLRFREEKKIINLSLRTGVFAKRNDNKKKTQFQQFYTFIIIGTT